MRVGLNPKQDPWDTATQWGEELTSVKVGDRPGARRQLLERLNLRGHGPQRATKAEEGGPRTWLSKPDSSPTRHLAFTPTQGIRGQKDNKSYFSGKRSWTSGKIRAPLYDMPNC